MLQNLLAKWLDAPWVAAAAAEARRSGSRWARVHCSWHQRATATGRLSSSNPNLQAVTKYVVTSAAFASDGFGGVGAGGGGGGGGGGDAALEIFIRDAFVAPDGCLLLSADYRRARELPARSSIAACCLSKPPSNPPAAHPPAAALEPRLS